MHNPGYHPGSDGAHYCINPVGLNVGCLGTALGPQTLKLASPTCPPEPPTFTNASKRSNAAAITSKLEGNTCNRLSKRFHLESKSFAHPPQRLNVASQTLTRACLRYPSPPLKYPLEKFGIKNSGKNVRLFGFKVQACLVWLKISVFDTKRGTSNIHRRISNIQRCQFEVQRCQFGVGGSTSEVGRGVFEMHNGGWRYSFIRIFPKYLSRSSYPLARLTR